MFSALWYIDLFICHMAVTLRMLVDLGEYCQAGAVSHMHINLCCCVGAVKFSEGDHRVGLICTQHASKTLTGNFLTVENDDDDDDDADEDE